MHYKNVHAYGNDDDDADLEFILQDIDDEAKDDDDVEEGRVDDGVGGGE